MAAKGRSKSTGIRARRYDVRAPVRYRTDPTETWHTAETRNVSRSGVLVRAACELDAASEWPIILEFNSVLVRVAARVVRKEEAAKSRGGSNQCLVGLTFVKPPPSVQAVLKDVCSATRDAATGVKSRSTRARWPKVSFVRCCPSCDSVNIEKRKRRHYECLDCGRQFVGIRVANLRVAL